MEVQTWVLFFWLAATALIAFCTYKMGYEGGRVEVYQEWLNFDYEEDDEDELWVTKNETHP